MNVENSLAIIGGYGKMGKATAEWAKQAGYTDIYIVDPNDPQTISLQEAIRQTPNLFISVLPIENIPGILRSIAGNIDENYRVLDNATVKKPLDKSYRVLDRRGISICSTHPLFKEDQPPLNQNALISPYGRNSEPATLIAERIYGSVGMKLYFMEFNRNDDASDFTQFYPHLLGWSEAELNAEYGPGFKVKQEIGTANSRLRDQSGGRTWLQNPPVSAAIIENALKRPGGVKKARRFVQIMNQMIKRAQVPHIPGQPGELETSLRETANTLDPTGEIRGKLNLTTTALIETITNLGSNAVTIKTSRKDEPSLLVDLLEVVSRKNKINILAIQSSQIGKPQGVLTFYCGFENLSTLTPEIIEEINAIGFSVEFGVK